MSKRRVWFFTLWVLPLALIVSACSGAGRSEVRSTEGVTVTGTPEVTVESFNGEVQITAGPAGKVSADIVKFASASGADGLQDISFAFSGNTRAVQAKAAWTGATSHEDVGVDLRVRVPVGSDVHIVLGSGKVAVGPEMGDITIAAGSADVTLSFLSEAQFSLQATLGYGQVRSDFDGVPSGPQVGPIAVDVGQQPLRMVLVSLGSGTLSLEKHP